MIQLQGDLQLSRKGEPESEKHVRRMQIFLPPPRRGLAFHGVRPARYETHYTPDLLGFARCVLHNSSGMRPIQEPDPDRIRDYWIW